MHGCRSRTFISIDPEGSRSWCHIIFRWKIVIPSREKKSRISLHVCHVPFFFQVNEGKFNTIKFRCNDIYAMLNSKERRKMERLWFFPSFSVTVPKFSPVLGRRAWVLLITSLTYFNNSIFLIKFSDRILHKTKKY